MAGFSVGIKRGVYPISGSHDLTMFFECAYAFSWLVSLPMALFHAPLQYTALASFGPTIASLIVHRRQAGNFRAFRIFANWRRTLVTSGLGIALVVLTYVVLPGLTTADPHKLHWRILASTGVYNYSTLLGGPLGEEPGWRGCALPRLEARLGPFRGSLLLGILWAGWRLPLFLIPNWTTAPVWVFGLIMIGLSLILSYGANLARFCGRTLHRYARGLQHGVSIPGRPHRRYSTQCKDPL